MNPRRTYTPTFLFVLLLICAFAPVFMIRESKAQGTGSPMLYIAPSIAYGEENQTITVSVMISNVFSLWSHQVYLNYSSDILEIARNQSTIDENSPYAYYVYEGDFLKRGAWNPFWVAKVNNTAGTFQAWESLVVPAPDVEGNGELFRIVFKVKKPGSSVIHLYDTDLRTKFNVPIIHGTTDGAVTNLKIGILPTLLKGEDYPPGSSFDVNVSLTGAIENFYGYDLNVTYSVDVLNLTSVTLLPLLEMPNENQTEIDYVEGRIRLFMNCSAPASPINTTGAIATLRFEVLPSEEKTDIDVTNSTLYDAAGHEIIHMNFKATFTGGLIRNIGLVDAAMSAYAVNAGDNVTLTINAYNNGTRNETFTIVVHAVSSITVLAGGPTQFTIDSNQTKILTMTLGTRGLGGNYTMYVNMSWLPDESLTGDNEYVIPSMLSVTPTAEIQESPFGTTFYVAIAIIIVVVVVVLIFLLRRRR